jgi:acyl carrier protein
MSNGTATAPVSALEREVVLLVVETLRLPTPPDELPIDAPLFGDELGLDSIDVLEIALALSRRYGVEIRADDAANPGIFSSLRSLAAFVAAHRTH